ncbi:hypothetical protein SpCBS45565_g07318 [Spizellomyces sp. 'palustris']|nr:hypothetical protein SpCBS45565_g07318 [Spizellomyces sp. 'palustris']
MSSKAPSKQPTEKPQNMGRREVDTQPNLFNMTTTGETVMQQADDSKGPKREPPRATLTVSREGLLLPDVVLNEKVSQNMTSEDDEQIWEKAP